MLKSDFDGYEDPYCFSDEQLEFWADEGCPVCLGAGKYKAEDDWCGELGTFICDCALGNFADYGVAVKGDWRYFKMPRPVEWRYIGATVEVTEEWWEKLVAFTARKSG